MWAERLTKACAPPRPGHGWPWLARPPGAPWPAVGDPPSVGFCSSQTGSVWVWDELSNYLFRCLFLLVVFCFCCLFLFVVCVVCDVCFSLFVFFCFCCFVCTFAQQRQDFSSFNIHQRLHNKDGTAKVTQQRLHHTYCKKHCLGSTCRYQHILHKLLFGVYAQVSFVTTCFFSFFWLRYRNYCDVART